MKVLSSTKRFWKTSTLLKSRKKASNLRFRCIVEPVKVTVKMGKLHEPKVCCTQAGRKTKAYYTGEWSTHQGTGEKKASWYKNQQTHPSSQCSSNLSDTETPQPACPAGSVASWVRFSFNPPEGAAEGGSSSARYGLHARNHQRATGDKQHGLEISREGTESRRFLQHPVGMSVEEPAAPHSEHPHEHFNPPFSESNFIPSPILPGPRQVVYSALASETISRTHLNGEDYAYPHSPRGPQHRLGLEWRQQLPAAQQAEVYVYLISPSLPSPEHNLELPNHPFAASAKDTLANRMSFSQSRGSSSQGPGGQGSSGTHKQRKSIWERKHQRKSLQPNSDYEKLAESSGGASLGHHEAFSHNLPLSGDRGRGLLNAATPTIAS